MTESLCDLSMGMPGGVTSDICKGNPNKKKGRYASQSLNVNGKSVIVGGMVYDRNGHDPVNTVRETSMLDDKSWSIENMGFGRGLKKKRAFFCAVKVQDSGLL